MKLTVLGATGPTGMLVVQQALERGHSVTAYVRRRGDLPSHPNFNIVIGELDDASSMEKAFRGSDAVISCLGVHPGSKAAGSVNLMSKAMPAIIQCMRSAGVSRIVVLSAVGVGASKNKTSWFMRLIYRLLTAAIFEDKASSERVLTGSDRDWTLVCPPILTHGLRTGNVQRRDITEMNKINGLAKVSRADVADVLIDAAAEGSWSRKTVVVTP